MRCRDEQPRATWIYKLRVFQSSSHILLTNVGLLLTTPGYSEPNSMQDLTVIDQHQLSKRLQDIVDEGHVNADENLKDGDYEDVLRMGVAEPSDDDVPPPLPPRQLK